MTKHLITSDFSVIALVPSKAQLMGSISNSQKTSAIFTVGVERAFQVHFFRDLTNGTSLWLKSNGTFQLSDLLDYDSGTVLAKQMVFEKDDISVWHQDQRFSFTCQANVKSGFCFGWLIDRRYSKSYRILDPGKVG